MFLFQNLRFLVSWEMQVLGKTAGCGGKSPAQELSPRLASHQPHSGNTMANTHHRLAAPTWGNPRHCPHISEGLPWGSSLLRGGSGALLDQGATRPSPTSSPQFWELARSLSLLRALLCGQGCPNEVIFLPWWEPVGYDFQAHPTPTSLSSSLWF